MVSEPVGMTMDVRAGFALDGFAHGFDETLNLGSASGSKGLPGARGPPPGFALKTLPSKENDVFISNAGGVAMGFEIGGESEVLAEGKTTSALVPSRTLLVKNAGDDADDEKLKDLLRVFGEIESVKFAREEGVATVVYFDLRAAKTAKKELQGHYLSDRLLDVSYAAGDEAVRKDERGRIVVPVEPHLGSQELVHIFSTYGDVRVVQDVPDLVMQKVIEFYDWRQAEKAVTAVNRVGNGETLSQASVFPAATVDHLLDTLPGGFPAPQRVAIEKPAAPGSDGMLGNPLSSVRSASAMSFAGGNMCGGGMVVPEDSDKVNGWADHCLAGYDLSCLSGMGMGPMQVGSPLEAGMKASDSASSFTHKSFNVPPGVTDHACANGVWGGSDTQDSRDSNTPSGCSVEQFGSVGSAVNEQLSRRRALGFASAHCLTQLGDVCDAPMSQPGYFSGVGSPPITNCMSAQGLRHDAPAFDPKWAEERHEAVDGQARLNTIKRDLPAGLGLYEGDGGSNEPYGADPSCHLLPADLQASFGENFCASDGMYSSFGMANQYPATSPMPMMGNGVMNDSQAMSRMNQLGGMNGGGLAPTSAGFGSSYGPQINDMMATPSGEALLNQYLQSLNQAALLQQAVGMEVLKRLTSVGGPGIGLDNPLEKLENLDLNGKAGAFGVGWGSADRNAGRRRGCRFGRRGANIDPGVEAERKLQQERMFALDLDRIASGSDKRTTLMIKNIPNKYTQKMLLATIEEECEGMFDFFYLPIDFKNRCNVGYGFINMNKPENIVPFVEKFHRKRWEKFNSEKVCCVTYARIQGRAALINHFQNSSLMQEDSRHRPLLFTPDGELEPFPNQPIA